MKKLPHISTLRNILILRAEGALGDAIRTSCCYRSIKQANPNIKITVACFGTNIDYLAANPYIDTLVKLPIRRHLRANQRWIVLTLAALKLRRQKFDLVLDSSNVDLPNWHFFKWLVGGNRVLDKFTCPVAPFGSPHEHMAQHELSIVKLLGIQSNDFSYDLPIPQHTQEQITAWLKQNDLSDYILLNPTGSTTQKKFTPAMLTKLMDQLASFHMPVIIPSEPSSYSYWHQAIPSRPGIFIKRTDSIFELFDLVRRAKLVVTPDTAALHVSSGFQRPTIAFYNEYCIQNDPANPKCIIIRTAPNDINAFEWNTLTDALAQVRI